MRNDEKNVRFVLPHDENSYTIASDFASAFTNSAKVPKNLAERFIYVVSECTRNISLSSRRSDLKVELKASKLSATAELSGNILLSDSIMSSLADEVLAASIDDGTKIKIVVFEPDTENFEITASDSDVTFAPIKNEEIPRVCSIYRKFYGSAIPWASLTIAGKMQQLMSQKKMLVLGAYNKENKLVGSIAARIQNRPFYIEIYPPASANGVDWENKGIEFLLKKLKFLKPDWILRYINDYPQYLSTPVGTMVPIGLMHHHSLSNPMQIIGKALKPPSENEFYLPPQYSDSFELTMEMLGILSKNAARTKRNISGERVKYILKYETRNNTAIVRIKSYGSKLSHSVMIISNIFGGIARKKIGTLYLDLPLTEPITAALGEKLISSGFGILGYIPGNFLRLQKTIGNPANIDKNKFPENIASFAKTLR